MILNGKGERKVQREKKVVSFFLGSSLGRILKRVDLLSPKPLQTFLNWLERKL